MPTKTTTRPADSKNWFIGLLTLNILTILLIAVSFFYQSENKFAYVDGVKLVTGYKGMELAKKELELKSEIWKSNLDTLQRELEKSISDYESTKNRLSAKEKSLTEELIKTKQEQFVSYQEVVSTNLQKADQELSSKVLEQVNDYIKRYGERNGLTIIFAATQYGNIAYANKELDLTETLLKGLNEEYETMSK